LHLFLIPLERVSGDSQMIFVHAEHTPFAAGAKRRDRTEKFIRFQKIASGTRPFVAWAALPRRRASVCKTHGVPERSAVRKQPAQGHRHVTLAAPRVRLAQALEKWNPAFRSGHAQPKNLARIPTQSHRDAL
jgi:hypothetical protein